MTVLHTTLVGRRAASQRSTIDFAWQVHAAMESSTSRADLKASVLLALQGGAIVVASTSQVVGADATSSGRAMVFAVGTAVLIVAMCLAAAALMPALGSPRRQRREHRRNIVYFGHIRMWPGDQLIRRLVALTDDEKVAMVAAQLAVLSRLNWRKHRLLQLSVVLTMLAFLGLVTAVVALNQFPSSAVLITSLVD
jgi:hypothetical protein